MARKHKYASALNRLRPGKASQYIKHIEDIPAGTRVVLWERVSKRDQGRNGQNIHDQDQNLWQRAKELGLERIAIFDHEGSGYGVDSLTLLAKAAAYAIEHDAIIFAESTSRLIRHPGFHSKRWPDAQARDADLRMLPTGVVIATDLHPDASPSEVRAYDRRRGQRIKQQFGGRPPEPGYKKRRRQKLESQVRVLTREGHSQKSIARMTGLPRTTVQRWISGR